MEISQRIKMERQAAKWTQDQLADKIFVSKRTISNWETGKTVPDIESVLHLSKVFQVSLDDLLVTDSAVVKEIKRKEKIANLTGLYYIGPGLTGIILILMMYLSSAIVRGGILYFITAALLTNFITLSSFKWKIAHLKGEEEKFHKEMKWTKIAGAGIVVITCIFLIILSYILFENGGHEMSKVFKMSFASIYPMYLQKIEKKGRSKEELDQVIYWLTGYDEQRLQKQIDQGVDMETFFAEVPQLNENVTLIKGVICGYRVEDIEDPLMQKIRYLDKLVDELAKGKKLEKILRK